MAWAKIANWKYLILLFASQAIVAQAQSSCAHDVYFLIDASSGVDPFPCFGLGSYTTWNVWKQKVSYIMNLFQPQVDDGSINAGVQLYGTAVETLANYDTAPTFAAAVAGLAARPAPLCGAPTSFVNFLSEAVDENHLFSNWMYNGPINLRPRETTTRTAIIFTMTGQNGFTDANIAYRMQPVHTQFDNEIYITMTTTVDAELDAIREHQLRIAACGNLFANCTNIFDIDQVNDDGVPISLESFNNYINAEGCISRPVEITEFVATCANASVEFSIPTNMLDDLTSADLQALDPMCNLTTYTTISGSNTVVTLPLGACGAIEQVNGNNTDVFQQITTISGTPFALQFNATCAYPNTVEEILGPLKPDGIVVAQNITQVTDYPLTLNLFLDSSYSSPLSGFTAVMVGTTMYMEGTVPLSDGLTLVLVSVVATSTTSPVSSPMYSMVSSNCPTDNTFNLVSPQPNPHTVRASFDMFQFASDVQVPNVNKLPVYVHATFLVCLDSDTSLTCTPGCLPSRRKRSDVGGEHDIVTQTIGPIYVDDGKPKHDVISSNVGSENDASFGEEEMQLISRRIEVMIPSMSPTVYTVMGHLAFLAVALVVGLLLMRQYLQRPSASFLHASHGIVPYHHSAKTPLDLQDCYINTTALPPQCQSCCEKVDAESTVGGDVNVDEPPVYEP